MTKKTRRNHSPAFKSKVALAALKGEKTIAQLADQFGIHVSQVSDWKEQLLAGAVDLFEVRGGAKTAAPEIDVKSLHAKIGELTLENDFLESALGKAGFLSAKR